MKVQAQCTMIMIQTAGNGSMFQGRSSQSLREHQDMAHILGLLQWKKVQMETGTRLQDGCMRWILYPVIMATTVETSVTVVMTVMIVRKKAFII